MSDLTMAEFRVHQFARGKPLKDDMRDQHGPCMGFEDSAAYREYWAEQVLEAETQHILDRITEPVIWRLVEQHLRQMVPA